ncbi:MAG: DNA translocase FtsK 4TM domain-containing protein [Chloroflexota bacterium]
MAQKKTSKKSTKRTVQKKGSATRGGTKSRSTSSSRKKTTSSRKPASTRKKTTSTRKKSTSSRRKTTTRRTVKQQSQQRALVLGAGTIFITILVILSLLSPNQGQLTQSLSLLVRRLFGWGALAVPFITGAIGYGMFRWGMDQPLRVPIFRPLGFLLTFIVVEACFSLWLVTGGRGFATVWSVAEAGSGGGYFGSLFAYVFTEAIGVSGAILALFVVGMLGVVWMSGLTREEFAYWYGEVIHWWNQSVEDRKKQPIRGRRAAPTYRRGGKAVPLPEGAPHQPPLIPDPVDVVQGFAEDEPAAAEEKPQTRVKKRPSRRQPKREAPVVEQEPTIVSPVYLGRNGRKENWQLPDLTEMLEPGMDLDPSGAAIREQVEIIEHTLESFGAPASIVEINQGPTITQFGVEPSFIQMRNGKRTKVKVSKIAGLADDLSLALAAESIRVQAPVPGKGYIGIEVPNPDKAVVSLRDVLESSEFKKIKSPLGFGLGQDVAGQPIVADLASMPHLLIAGTTGSGKSVCVNGIIASLLLQNTPETLKLVMVDPKRVELTGYNGIPHLAAQVIVEIDKVIGTLQWALREMDSRYKMFAEVGARNIIDFNKKVRRNAKYDNLPYIVIIIDELADLMMLSPEDTERSITRLAQLARATGMHMVIATQRPSVDVVTGLIKANFPARVAFAVASGTDSRVILDASGAERLLGQGDMLYQAPDAPAPIRAQGCWVSDPELKKLIAYWKGARRFNVVSAEESALPRASAIPPVTKPVEQREPDPPAQPDPPAANGEETAVEAPIVNMEAPVKLDDAKTVRIEPVKAKPKARPNPKPRRPGQNPPIEPPAVEETAVIADDTPTRPTPAQQPLWEALEAEENDTGPERPDDDLLDEAIALVRELKKASTSLLQRRFRIGYTRAARLIDYMDEAGIIGPPTGTSKAREVLPWGDAEAVAETAVDSDPASDEENDSEFDIEFGN